MRDDSQRRDLLHAAFEASVSLEPLETWGPVVTAAGGTLAFDAFDEAFEVPVDVESTAPGRAIAVRHPHDPERLLYVRRDENGWTAWCAPAAEPMNHDDESGAWPVVNDAPVVLYPVVERDGRLLVCG